MANRDTFTMNPEYGSKENLRFITPPRNPMGMETLQRTHSYDHPRAGSGTMSLQVNNTHFNRRDSPRHSDYQPRKQFSMGPPNFVRKTPGPRYSFDVSHSLEHDKRKIVGDKFRPIYATSHYGYDTPTYPESHRHTSTSSGGFSTIRSSYFKEEKELLDRKGQPFPGPMGPALYDFARGRYAAMSAADAEKVIVEAKAKWPELNDFRDITPNSIIDLKQGLVFGRVRLEPIAIRSFISLGCYELSKVRYKSYERRAQAVLETISLNQKIFKQDD